MGLINRESRVWSATGIQPASGDEVYSAGEQPIAGYDNWAMWSVTSDIKALNDTFGDHNTRHQAGGADQIDLAGLDVGDTATLDENAGASELALTYPGDDTQVVRLDMNDQVVRAWPRFGTQITASQGAEVGDDLVRRDDGTAIYEYDTGYVQDAYHADTADYATNAGHADTADHATTADDADTVDGVHASAFVQTDDSPTWTGTHTHQNTVNADISGNAATADYATDAGDSDTLDGYHAQELINQASSSGEWAHIAETTHSTVGNRFTWQHTSSTTYDRYKLVIYHESHKNSGPKSYFWLQLGKGGYDNRYRYRWRERKTTTGEWTGHKTSDGFTVGGATPQETSVTTLYISCPRAVNSPSRHYPVVGSDADESPYSVPQVFHYGELQTNFSTIDTVRLRSDGTVSTGKIALYGQNL